MTRNLRLAPSEGWVSVGLLLVICLTMAWSIDDVGLVLGRRDFTDLLAPMSVLGAAAGLIGAKVGWGRWTTYAVGSSFAALIVPLAVGGVLAPDGTWFERYQATAASAVNAATDLAVRDLSFTTEYGHYLWVLGLVAWATGMFAAFATFGHRRPLNAIVMVGLVLLVNMALTAQDQLPYLVLFTLASLFLLVRFHVLDEQADWVRRHIGDPASISRLYLRGGAIFIAATVGGAVILTQVARSAPLDGAWSGFGTTVLEMTRSLQRLLPAGGDSRSFGADFDPNGTSIQGFWQPGDQLEMTVNVPLGDTHPYYWRAVTWDEFTGNGWRTSRGDPADVAATSPLLADSADATETIATQELTFRIDPARQSSTVFSPLTPTLVDQPVRVITLGKGRRLTAVTRSGGGPYVVTARSPIQGKLAGQLNQSTLRAAGQDYPVDIKAYYLQVPAGAIPKDGAADKLLEGLVSEVMVNGVLNPYDFAFHLQERFKASGPDALFTYDTDIRDLFTATCQDLSTVECFATARRGFCQYYATTMAIFLRAEGIPARVVQGFLPGERSKAGLEQIFNEQAHQWVEAYFPGVGWYTFDPTGGGLSHTVVLPVGEAVPSATPRASLPSFGSIAPDDQGPDQVGNPNRGTGSTGSARGALIVFALLLVIVVVGLGFVAWQRGPRGGTTPERAYRTVTRLAARFGFGPRPNQTVYEYAATLGEVIPIARPELETVARAKVETAYGRSLLGEDRLRQLRHAERRLRLNLLRLAFRRPRRGRR